MIKNLKINKDNIKLYTSCVLIATTTAVGMKISGIGLPFYVDNQKKDLYNTKLVSSNGDTKSFTTTDKPDNLLYHYGSWHPSNNNLMKRNYKVYRINTNSEEQLLEELKDIESFENKLGDYIIEGTEYKEIVSTENMDQNDYWQAFIYNKLDNNYVIIRETNLHNFVATLIYLLTTFGFCMVPYIDIKDKILEKKKD